MEYYRVKETGAHAYYTVVNEKCDLSFFYNKIDFKDSIEISYFINDKRYHKSKHVKILELEKELKTKNVFMVQVTEINKTAGWIASPNRGINNMDIGYEYVNLKK